jgi:hypothetical protein
LLGGKDLSALKIETVLTDNYNFFTDKQKWAIAGNGWVQGVGLACEYLGKWYGERGELRKAVKFFWDGRKNSTVCALETAKAFLSASRSPFGATGPVGWQLLATCQTGEAIYRLAMDLIVSDGRLPIRFEEGPIGLLKSAGELGCRDAMNEYLKRKENEE